MSRIEWLRDMWFVTAVNPGIPIMYYEDKPMAISKAAKDAAKEWFRKVVCPLAKTKMIGGL